MNTKVHYKIFSMETPSFLYLLLILKIRQGIIQIQLSKRQQVLADISAMKVLREVWWQTGI